MGPILRVCAEDMCPKCPPNGHFSMFVPEEIFFSIIKQNLITYTMYSPGEKKMITPPPFNSVANHHIKIRLVPIRQSITSKVY